MREPAEGEHAGKTGKRVSRCTADPEQQAIVLQDVARTTAPAAPTSDTASVGIGPSNTRRYSDSASTPPALCAPAVGTTE